MIFPVVRISELRADVERKKAALVSSSAGLRDEVLSKTQLLRFVMGHPKLIFGVGVSAVPILFLFLKKSLGLALPKKKSGFLSKIGFTIQMARILSQLLRKGFGPMATQLAQLALKSAFRF